ncbi:MAG: hypothetical protein NT023_03380, partial [Armatimonadetes bacterium]|nr:hypothetical protein [Armatimonadota bacterium]
LDVMAKRTPMSAIRDRLCEAISRANGIIDPRLAQKFLCIRTSTNSSVDLTVFKRFPQEEFECRVLMPKTSHIEILPNELELRHKDSDAHLHIGLDLFEILMRFTEGYQAGAEEQQGFVVDLVQFQNRLLNQRASELLLLEGGRELHRVRQQEGVITLIKEDWAQE